MKYVLLKNVSEEEAAVISPLLEAHGISVEMRYSAMAAPSVIILGRSMFGNNLYVTEDQLEEAKALLEELSKEIPPEELEAQALAAGEDAPASDADFDWRIADYGLDK